ncbi:hypothetical protein [Pelomonas sp. Root1444]|uniref:hypothetical protein n=1 Tax=Pelomonas sp. Root1444 TaxID=1736464 RepID=UPI0007024A34|nr:hypothetical protein [Pelomonas sp. Root1444]KQY89269.1 hypothetical protein ASD35_17425 [Pelomonas sp. Root1444]
MNLEDLLAAWGRGWAASRATPAPEPLGEGAWRIKVGLPGHRRRDLLPAWSPARLGAWADGVAGPGAWIKALADPATLALPAAWVKQPTEYLMSTPLQATAPPALAPGYRAVLTAGAAALECHVLAANGQLAAQARVGLAGPHAVFDQVATQKPTAAAAWPGMRWRCWPAPPSTAAHARACSSPPRTAARCTRPRAGGSIRR